MTDLKIMRKAAQHFKDLQVPVMPAVTPDDVLELIDRVEVTEEYYGIPTLINQRDDARALLKEAGEGFKGIDFDLEHLASWADDAHIREKARAMLDKIDEALK